MLRSPSNAISGLVAGVEAVVPMSVPLSFSSEWQGRGMARSADRRMLSACADFIVQR